MTAWGFLQGAKAEVTLAHVRLCELLICRYVAVCLRGGTSLQSQLLLWQVPSCGEDTSDAVPVCIAAASLTALDALAYEGTAVQLAEG